MKLKDVIYLELAPTADMHVHLRQDEVDVTRSSKGADKTNSIPSATGHGISDPTYS